MVILQPLSSRLGNVSTLRVEWYLYSWVASIGALSPIVQGDIALSINTHYNTMINASNFLQKIDITNLIS